MDASLQQKAIEYINSNKTKIMNNPNSLKNRIFGSQPSKMITVVTPSYNAESFISKTIDSVVNQTIGMDNIQYIIIDDCSTDGTPSIIRDYAAKHENICFVSLKENTGSPGLPRNIGIELATSKYITFLDADDWLAPEGLERLCTIFEESGDDYVIGKTVKVENTGESIIGEFNSYTERRNESPFDIPYFFYHMGPTARAVRLSVVKQHNIRFPEMKFGEDKLFFIEVFLHAKSVATTTAPIYYVNRTNENPGSLTRVTATIDKRRMDLKIIKYIKTLNLDIKKEKIILNRIYEYDFLRTFDSMLFVRSKQQEDFLALLREVVATTEDLQYDFKEEFKNPLYRTAIELFVAGREDDFVKLFKWHKYDKAKKHVIIDSLPYNEVPFLEAPYRFVRIPMFAKTLDSYVIDNKYIQTFEVYGDSIDAISDIVIRDRNDYKNEISVDFHIIGNVGHFQVDFEKWKPVKNSLFTIFIKYSGYQIINIKRIASIQVNHEDKIYDFYTSKTNNLSLSIKNSK